ncbi:carbon-nitrogen hydrolase family protein [Gordonia sp. SID5947]|uniref:nitrilase-related carbon-nitrogen hydrolase n=1 Tax=Gordonia sp. SID5947 TaxID=2690315 RepID=UPI0019268F3F
MGKAAELRVTVGQPIGGSDLLAAVGAHAVLVRAARADVMVFPELSLTGYEVDAVPVDLRRDRRLFDGLIDACASSDTCALVGAPVIENGCRSIAFVRVDTDGVEVVYRKRHLGGQEIERFTPGPAVSTVDIRGWRFGFGICRDTGVETHTEATAALGIDVYAAGVVHHRSELSEQLRRASDIGARCGAYVAMASCAGPTGGGYRDTAGNSVIMSAEGTVLAQAGEIAGDYVTAVLR